MFLFKKFSLKFALNRKPFCQSNKFSNKHSRKIVQLIFFDFRRKCNIYAWCDFLYSVKFAKRNSSFQQKILHPTVDIGSWDKIYKNF